jgi:hypothetical protein
LLLLIKYKITNNLGKNPINGGNPPIEKILVKIKKFILMFLLLKKNS